MPQINKRTRLFLFIFTTLICVCICDDELWEKFPKTYTASWNQNEKNEVSKIIKRGTQTVWSLIEDDKQYQKRMEIITEESVVHLVKTNDQKYYGWIIGEDGSISKCSQQEFNEDLPNTFQWIKDTSYVGLCPPPYNNTENKLYVMMKEAGITTICFKSDANHSTFGDYFKPIYFEFKSIEGNLLTATIDQFDPVPPADDIFKVPKECSEKWDETKAAEEAKKKEEEDEIANKKEKEVSAASVLVAASKKETEEKNEKTEDSKENKTEAPIDWDLKEK